MRILVCGCRDWTDVGLIEDYLESIKQFFPLNIISGGAKGADKIAENWANIWAAGCKVYKADWAKYGKNAGFIRNQQMIDEGKPDLVLAFWDGRSNGTRDMVFRAVKHGIETRIIPKKDR